MSGGLDLIGICRRLIAVPSPTGDEGPAVDQARRELEDAGFDRVWVDEHGNCVGRIDGRSDGGGVLFDAHIDTVGPGDLSLWTRDPFGGEVAGDRLYGRGASDMKGALSAMIAGIASLKPRGLIPHGPVYVCVSLAEEITEGLALAPVLAEVSPSVVIIGEATDLSLNVGGRGRAEIALEVAGQSAHSSQPRFGVNAVDLLADALVAVRGMPLPTDERVGDALAVVTDVWSEPFPSRSVLPHRAGAVIDRRLVPGETPEDVLHLFRRQLEGSGMSVADGSPAPGQVALRIVHEEITTYTGSRLAGDKFAPAWSMDPEGTAVRAALDALTGAGLSPSTGYFRFCTNGSISAGKLGITTLGFGPGLEENAHVTDEWVSVDSLHRAADGYAALALALSGPGPWARPE